MTPEETIKLFEAGRDKWNDWAKSRLQAKEELTADTRNSGDGGSTSAERLEIWKNQATANFRQQVFRREVDFSGYIFPSGADFTNTDFQEKALFNDAAFIGAATFGGALFQQPVSFALARFDQDGNFQEARFKSDLDFSGAAFARNANLVRIKVEGQSLWSKASFRKGNFNGADFFGFADLRNCQFGGGPSFSGTNFDKGVNFSGLSLSRARFDGASLREAGFSNANLENANFSDSDLTKANLLGAHVNTSTRFDQAIVANCRINRFTLDCLDNFGGLSVGARMKMDVRDDLAILRQSYSGFLRWAHLGALLAFIFPYAWFLGSRWGEAQFLDDPNTDHIALWNAFARYIFNGGINWQQGYRWHWSFLLFCYALVFNFLRGFLLWKTTALEFHQEVTGVPAEFSLSEPIVSWPGFEWYTWGMWLAIAKFAVITYFGVVALNAWHFFTMQVPLTGQ